jgi:hypothetical protein
MALGKSILDDRSYEQLRDELVRRIPVYAPEWTDHNPSDPGITLLELFAYLGENLLYRFNQIPESAYLELLNLLDLPLRPAVAARALLALETEQADGVLVAKGQEAKAGNIPFELENEVRVWPLAALAVAKAARPLPAAAEEPEVFGFFEAAVDALGGLAEDQEPAAYSSERVSGEPGAPPTDFDATVDGILWVAVLAPKAPADAGELLARRKRLLEPDDQKPVYLNLGFVPDLAAPPAREVPPCPGEGGEADLPPVEWEISTGRFDSQEEPIYRPLQLLEDGTRGLSQEGVLRLAMPRKLEDGNVFTPADRDRAGTGALPPPLDDEAEARILFWLRAWRHDGSRFGKVAWVGANAAAVVQTRGAKTEFLGVGNAQPHQEMQLVHRPVIAGSLSLEVESAEGWTAWQEVDGFHASREDDRHYVLDAEAGRVRFGNGLQGRAPQLGERVRSRGYRYGGGAAGNVAPAAISKIDGVSAAKGKNPLAAWGGADKETTAEALQRIPGELRRRDRAVTRGDFRELALATPSGGVGRAECLATFNPHTRDRRAAGVVSVVVWPRQDPAHPNAPLPDRRLLRSVCRFLDARRLLTTEVYVIPPTYRKVAVSVGLKAKPLYGAETVRRWVELVLRQYLAPLPPYGPEGKGWPLGRRVHGPELEAAALQVEGVEFLEGLRVAGWNAQSGAWEEGTVELDLDEVPELVEITVVAGAPEEPGQALGPLPPAKTPVPIPVLRQEC